MESDFYFEFENKFRGDQDAISKALGIYDSLIHQTLNHVSNPKILDIGCGRGEFLEKWKKYIPNVLGIENDSITTIENFISSLDIQTNLSYLNIDIINELNNIKLMVNSERFNNNPFKISIDAIFNQ